MADIIKLDKSRRRIAAKKEKKNFTCDHKNVTVYAEYRTVRCSFCGVSLDPFDVLLDMVRGYIPAERPNDRE